MEKDSLVQKIVSEVLKKIEEDKEIKERRILFLEEESEEIKLKYSLFISDWDEIDFIDENIAQIKNYDLVICPKLSIIDLVDIANGRPSSKVSSIIIEAILYGVKVTCIEEGIDYRKFKSLSNENFYLMMTEYEQKLLSFGIEIVKCSQIKESLNDIYEENKFACEEHGYLVKKVVTQSDIERLYHNGHRKICIKKDSLITPLAKDYINMNHLELKKV